MTLILFFDYKFYSGLFTKELKKTLKKFLCEFYFFSNIYGALY